MAEVDDISSILKQSFKPRSEQAATEVENAVQTLVTQALQDSSLVKDDVIGTVEEMIARIDEKLSAQMNEILHAKEFQQLESSWRGLHYLVFNSETDATLKIKVLNIGKTELYRHFKLFPGARWDQSPVFKAVYEQEFGTLGGQPYGALVADYHFSHSPTDISVMRDLSKIASAALAPLVTGADPNLLGMDSWRELMNPRDIGKLMDTPDYAAWKGLRDAVDSRYLALCMPRVLARLPYGAKSEPVHEFAFEEDTDGHDGAKYGWMNAAYAMAANINRAYKEYGWTVRIRGVQSGGEVINLPTYTFPTDDGGVDLKCPTEIAITDRREAELSKAGLISIIHRKNTDKAAFIGAQSVYKPRSLHRQGSDGLRQPVGAHSLHVRGVALRALSEGDGARQDRLDEREGPAAEVAQRVDLALCRRRSQELQRRGEGAVPARRRPDHGHRERREPRLLLGRRSSAPAFPARGHGYRHEPGLQHSAGEKGLRPSKMRGPRGFRGP